MGRGKPSFLTVVLSILYNYGSLKMLLLRN